VGSVGAVGQLFSFDGRINRLGYLLRSLAALLLLSAVCGLALLAVAFIIRPDGVAGMSLWFERVTLAVSLFALWSGFALASRRLRDMGLEPAYIIPAYAALWVINTVLLAPLSRLDPDDYGAPEMAWEVLRFLAAIPLLFWPGRARREQPGPAEYAHVEPTAYINWRD
jgi:uncharacterized membrane protein YhaH (DUF805 family)